MGKEFSIEPVEVTPVDTRHRRITTALPAPQSVVTLETLRNVEPISMRGQPPVVWDRAEGFQVHDAYGNMWLDFSCGVLVTNAGHGTKAICDAIRDQVDSGLIHNYCFPSEERAQLVTLLKEVAPEGLDKVFLLTTGSEATECAIKLARTHGIAKGGDKKIGIVGADRGFHGRTLASQMTGGIPGQKDWIVNLDPAIVQVPWPDGYWTEDTSFDLFLKTLEERGMSPENVAGVMFETFQGVGPDFAPVEYIRELRQWCDNNEVVLIFDEVQAGFGRTGKMWAFEHYGVNPDLICIGKGVTSSLPLSGVIGKTEIVDAYPPGSMTSTHTGNPLSCRAAIASIRSLIDEDLIGNAARLESVLENALAAIAGKHPDIIGRTSAKGLVGGLQVVKPGTRDPSHDLAFDIIERAFHKGLLLFAPVGAWGQTVKLAPPLCITKEALEEGLEILAGCVDEAVDALE
ncbi:MAG: aspartate aminotransferase family protein [Verrucomicrobiota bacterium]|nr:aspartate aminotransferase family protein [Verrucomicrobiota bacterium]